MCGGQQQSPRGTLANRKLKLQKVSRRPRRVKVAIIRISSGQPWRPIKAANCSGECRLISCSDHSARSVVGMAEGMAEVWCDACVNGLSHLSNQTKTCAWDKIVTDIGDQSV